MQTRLLLLPVLVLGVSCSMLPDYGDESSAGADSQAAMISDPNPDPPASLDIPNFTILTGKVAGGGFISAEQVTQLPAKGYTTIINLQNENEPGVTEERAAAEAAGLHYISIPVSGSNFTLEDGHAVTIALAQNPGHTLLHCRSGARASAVWALSRAIVEGLSPEEAAAVAATEGCRPISESMVQRVVDQLTPEEARHHDS